MHARRHSEFRHEGFESSYSETLPDKEEFIIDFNKVDPDFVPKTSFPMNSLLWRDANTMSVSEPEVVEQFKNRTTPLEMRTWRG
jgi:hypothetical protein